MNRYYLVCANNIDDLMDWVEKYLNNGEGWELQGGIAVATWIDRNGLEFSEYCQAVIIKV